LWRRRRRRRRRDVTSCGLVAIYEHLVTFVVAFCISREEEQY
jgi:hypothetical protein